MNPVPSEINSAPESNQITLDVKSLLQAFDGGSSEPLGETRILSTGVVDASALNSEKSEKMHFLPPSLRLRCRVIAFALMASAIAIPYTGHKASAAIINWNHEREVAAMQVKAEAAARLRAEADAALMAAEKLNAEKHEADILNATAFLASLVENGLKNVGLPATPAAAMFNPESMKTWASTFWTIDAAKGPITSDFVEEMTMTGVWSKAVQYRAFGNHSTILTAVVDDNGVRKIWVGRMSDTSGRGTGQPQYILSVRGIPGVDDSKLYLPPEIRQNDFKLIRDDFVAALTTNK